MIGVTFTRTTRTYDPTTGASTATTATVTASAAKVRPNRTGEARYRELGLTIANTIVLLVATDTYGDAIRVGDTVEWADETWTVRDVEEVAPDGVAIISRVAVTR